MDEVCESCEEEIEGCTCCDCIYCAACEYCEEEYGWCTCCWECGASDHNYCTCWDEEEGEDK